MTATCAPTLEQGGARLLNSAANGTEQKSQGDPMPQITANGVRLEYDERGPKDGAPILLIHGFGSQMTSWPDEFPQGLADAGLRVVRFDNRDVGLSQKWDGILPDGAEARGTDRPRRETRSCPMCLPTWRRRGGGLLDELGITQRAYPRRLDGRHDRPAGGARSSREDALADLRLFDHRAIRPCRARRRKRWRR